MDRSPGVRLGRLGIFEEGSAATFVVAVVTGEATPALLVDVLLTGSGPGLWRCNVDVSMLVLRRAAEEFSLLKDEEDDEDDEDEDEDKEDLEDGRREAVAGPVTRHCECATLVRGLRVMPDSDTFVVVEVEVVVEDDEVDDDDEVEAGWVLGAVEVRSELTGRLERFFANSLARWLAVVLMSAVCIVFVSISGGNLRLVEMRARPGVASLSAVVYCMESCVSYRQ